VITSGAEDTARPALSVPAARPDSAPLTVSGPLPAAPPLSAPADVLPEADDTVSLLFPLSDPFPGATPMHSASADDARLTEAADTVRDPVPEPAGGAASPDEPAAACS
jgi:hypothetical protein